VDILIDGLPATPYILARLTEPLSNCSAKAPE
jgi:hypothetical protein